MTIRRNCGGILLPLAVLGCAWGCSPESGVARRLPDIRVAHDANLAARLETVRAAHGVPGIGAALLRQNGMTVAVAGRAIAAIWCGSHDGNGKGGP